MGGPRVKWDDRSEDLLLEGLKKATAEARTGDNNFQPSVYQSILTTLREHGYEIDADKVKAQWSRVHIIPTFFTFPPVESFTYSGRRKTDISIQLKTAHNNVAHLRGLSGFGWDEARQVVVATEDVWKRVLYDEKGQKVKKFKDYNVWQSKAFPHFKTIMELIGGNQAVGNNAFSSQKGSAAAPPVILLPGPTAPHSVVPPATASTVSSTERESQDVQDFDILSDGSAAASQGASPGLNSRVDIVAMQPVSSATPSASASRSKRSVSPPPPPTTPVSNKRPKAANTHSHLTVLCQLVGKLVDSMTGESNTPSDASKFLPVRAKAWDYVQEKEGLSPHSLSWARRVFHSDICVKEYLSFKDEQAEARALWLYDEIEWANSN